MFKFFTDKRWHLWSIGGTILILAATWYQVQLDVRINEWFGEFYDTLQKALAEPGAVTEKEFIAYLFLNAENNVPSSIVSISPPTGKPCANLVILAFVFFRLS